MIAAKYTQGGKFEVGPAEIPSIGDGDMLLRVEASAICGSDIKIIQHGHRKLRDGQTIILGHEFVGSIERVGSRVEDFSVGERVGVAPNIGCGACEMCRRGLMNMCPDYSAFGIDRDGAHTEFVSIPAASIRQGSVIRISPEVSPLEGALAEPLSCAVNSVRLTRVQAGDVVLVYGAGPMGLLNAMVASISGASRVLVVDRNDERLQTAQDVGADAVLNSLDRSVPEWVKEQTGGRGVDAVITAVPLPELQQEAIQLLAPFGRLCLFAGLPRGTGEVALDTNAIHYKNLLVTGMTGGAPRDYRAALRLISSARINLSRLVSHICPIAEVGRAYELAMSGKGMKVVIGAEKLLRSVREARIHAPLPKQEIVTTPKEVIKR